MKTLAVARRAVVVVLALSPLACELPDPEPGAGGEGTGAGDAIGADGSPGDGIGNERTGVSQSSAALARIADDVWQRQLDRNATLRQREGIAVESLPVISHAGAEEDARFARQTLARLADLRPGELNHEEMLSYEILSWNATMQVEGLPCFWHSNIATPYSSPIRTLRAIFSGYVFSEPGDLDAYLNLVGQVPTLAGALHERVRGQHERGIVTPLPNIDAVVGLFRGLIQPLEKSIFHVADERLEGIDAAAVASFRERLADLVSGRIDPPLQELVDYLDGPYRDAAPAEVGMSQYPEGKECYAYLTRLHTTMEVTPEEVHEIGLERVADLSRRMDEIQESLGWEGTRDEFRQHLRTSPEFFPETADEVGERLQQAGEAMFARIGTLFPTTPQAPFGVRRLSTALEGSMTYGYYDGPTAADPKGYYNYNGSRLNERSWMNLESVAYHELVPGHHMHIALQMENESLPSFRGYPTETAYTEGWAVYASNLGQEAGLFEDPYSLYGHYVLDIFLATRLVVDTGMNLLGWSLDQGREFMRSHTLESETQIGTESLRYSTDIPGQALAYQMGRLKIDELRQKASSVLGAGFDLRRFHGAVLGSGSMPMAVLEKHIDRFIEDERDS